MIGDDQRRVAILMHLPAHAGNAGVARQQVGCRDLAQRDDQLRPYQVDLAVEIRLARQRLRLLGIAVAGRPAFDDVGNVHVLSALQPDRRQHAVEQLAGLAHERLALRVLVRAGTLAHEQPVGVLVADAEHGLVALRVQRAIGAARHPLFQLRPLQGHDVATAVVRRRWK
ncbi:hypothetical protein D3C83_05460 [compost metagenome]